MALQDTLAATATSLLSTYGESATFVREVESNYNPYTGQVDTTSSSFTANVYPANYSSYEIDGKFITSQDTKLLVDATNEPQVGDEVTFNSNTYRVLDKTEISISGSNVLYILQVRY